MKRFMAGATVWTFVGVVAYLSLTKTDTPTNTRSAPPQNTHAVAPPASPPAPPAMLADVVELTNLDPQLDPPIRPVGGVPFDAEPVIPAVVAPAPERIPLSID